MLTKATTAKKIANLGIDVYIGNGGTDNIIKSLLAKETGTFFKAEKTAPSNVKKWVAQSGDYSKACIIINEGAKEVLISKKASSLLPVGVISIEGSFKKGDVISIVDEKKKTIGLGKVAYDSKEAISYIGKRGHTPLVHYNYLVLS